MIHRALTVFSPGLSPLSLTSILVVTSFKSAVLEGKGQDFEDFVFFISPDCPTSTPVVSRKRTSRKCEAGSGVAASAGVDRLTKSDGTLGDAQEEGRRRSNAIWVF
jgi:hypothetical protein